MTAATAKPAGEEWWRPIPPETSDDAVRILAARALRAFADGFVAILLPVYLLELGLDVLAISAVIAATLIGSALLTLWVGIFANRHRRRHMLIAACGLMAATGAGFMLASSFWPLLTVAFIGTLNPSSGDVSLFLPLEHTVLAQAAEPRRRTALFARYSLAGTLAGSIGTLAAAAPDLMAWTGPWTRLAALQTMFGLYGAIGLGAFLLYRRLSPMIEAAPDTPPVPLRQSRKIVYGLTALFSIDAFGGGFFVQSLLALWLLQTYELSAASAASILFWSGLFSAASYLLAVPLADRFGLVNTMVFTHLPSNLFLILVPFAPNFWIAIALLFARSALSQMDVPTRSSYVMAVVTPEERPAAASLTAVPRSFASALSPLLAGYLMTLSSFGWPLLIGGALKAIYDLLLLAKFQKLLPPEEAAASKRA